MKNTIEQFAVVLEADQIRGLHARGVACQTNIDNSKVKIKVGKKFTKVDVGSSGKFMVENETGNIFGIKGYGVVHRGHFYGTLDTIGEYDWSEYYPTHKTAPTPMQKHSIPKLTFAPQPVATV